MDLTNYRKCLVCGYEWVRRDKSKDPVRCPNTACRSKKWLVGMAEGIRVSEIPDLTQSDVKALAGVIVSKPGEVLIKEEPLPEDWDKRKNSERSAWLRQNR